MADLAKLPLSRPHCVMWRAAGRYARQRTSSVVHRTCSLPRNVRVVQSTLARTPMQRFGCSKPAANLLPPSPLDSASTVGEAIHAATGLLKAQNVSEPDLSASYLMAAALVHDNRARPRVQQEARLSRATLQAIDPPSRPLLPAVRQHFMELVRKRALERVPTQYLVGTWDFHCLSDIEVVPPVLIPRPETEELVEHVLHQLQEMRDSHGVTGPRILDVGSGSGCIIISLLSCLPSARGVAADIAQHAVDLTRRNAAGQGVSDRLRVEHGDVWDIVKSGAQPPHVKSGAQPPQARTGAQSDAALAPSEVEALGLFDVLVSNPPYIPSSQVAELAPEVLQHEDHGALDGGDDGLVVVRQLLAAVSAQGHPQPLLRPGGRLWMEVDESHPAHMEEVVAEYPRLRLESCHSDFAGKPRFVCVSRV